MRMVDLILKKRAGFELTSEEIHSIIDGYCKGAVEDYQMAAFMMAVCFTGMTYGETAQLTDAMLHSGEIVDLSDLPGVKVDKHSTGGVGDTTTLVIAPLVAACGGTVAKMSGRGLGHTGGTLDKLESIPGVNVERSVDDMRDIVKRTGVCVIGQSGNLVPADKKMYALRDVTGTVKSIPLIASSIMSKKLAAGTDAILLDVKVGNGAFMETLEEARELAHTMVGIGKHLGKRTVAVITDMNQPLGAAIGNGLEMWDAIRVLSGKVQKRDLLYEVCILLASYMLLLGGIAQTKEQAEKMLNEAIESGRGLMKLRELIEALGGDTSYIDSPERLFNTRRTLDICADKDGYITHMDALKIGVASSELGAGREKKRDKIDPAVGILLKKRIGDAVVSGESVMTLYINDESRLTEVLELIDAAYDIGAEPVAPPSMVHDIITE